MSNPTVCMAEQEFPSFLMSPPLGISTDQANNAWMQEMADHDRRVDSARALRQFRDLYAFLAARALVYLLPTRPGLQDQTYVANLAAVLPHTANTAVVSTFRSEPRRGEQGPGLAFLRGLGYTIEVAPPYFEGEADLKHLKGNVYVGAHGLRTSRNTLHWFEDRFDMEVIPFEIVSEYLYHLDCSIFPITREEAVVCTELAEPASLAAIVRHVGIVDVSENDAESGITNCVRLGEHVLCASNIEELSASHEDYPYERAKIQVLEEICAKRRLTPVLFNLSEFLKSGAMLSCMVMHLNHMNY